MTNALVIGISLFHLIIIVWATIVGSRRGRPLLGFLLGLFLSWIGLILIYLIRPKATAYAR